MANYGRTPTVPRTPAHSAQPVDERADMSGRHEQIDETRRGRVDDGRRDQIDERRPYQPDDESDRASWTGAESDRASWTGAESDRGQWAAEAGPGRRSYGFA